MNTFVITCYRDQDRVNVPDQLEKAGAHICAIIKVPFWTIYGQRISEQFAVVYQAKEEVGVEVLC